MESLFVGQPRLNHGQQGTDPAELARNVEVGDGVHSTVRIQSGKVQLFQFGVFARRQLQERDGGFEGPCGVPDLVFTRLDCLQLPAEYFGAAVPFERRCLYLEAGQVRLDGSLPGLGSGQPALTFAPSHFLFEPG